MLLKLKLTFFIIIMNIDTSKYTKILRYSKDLKSTSGFLPPLYTIKDINAIPTTLFLFNIVLDRMCFFSRKLSARLINNRFKIEVRFINVNPNRRAQTCIFAIDCVFPLFLRELMFFNYGVHPRVSSNW